MGKMSVDRSRTWRSPYLADTLFLRADYRQQRFDRHFHEEFAIGVIDRGCQAFVYDDRRRLDMPGGSVALISPGVVHSGWPGEDQGWCYRMLYPSSETVRAAVSDVFGSEGLPTFNRPVVDDRSLFDCLSKLHELSGIAATDPLEIEQVYLLTVRAAFRRHAGLRVTETALRHAPGLYRARDVIEARHQSLVTLDELAQVAGLSRFQVLRQFKAAFGLPPHAYLRHVRVRRARAMVLSGQPLADTAAAVGFADQAHMTRAFRSTLGYTPGALARA
jgi:AraC-like DNA-binding protein